MPRRLTQQPHEDAPPRPATLKDIARRCQVSHVTVSRALRHDRSKVSDETYDRIWEVARELNYNPNLATPARRLAHMRSNHAVLNEAVALFIPSYRSMGPYFFAMVDGVMEEVETANFALLSVFPGKLPHIISRGDIDGGILLLPGEYQPLLESLRSEPGFGNRPLVGAIRPIPGASNVLVDDYHGGYAAMRHLLELGHREVLIGTYETPMHDARVRGARQACQDAGLSSACILHMFEWDSNKIAESEGLLERLQASHPGLTAVIAPNDSAAVEIWEYARRRKLRVPDDLSLIGFDDNIPINNAMGQNILTTIHINLHEVGRQAARLLIRQIRDEITTPETAVVPVTLIVRGTTAPPRR